MDYRSLHKKYPKRTKGFKYKHLAEDSGKILCLISWL